MVLPGSKTKSVRVMPATLTMRTVAASFIRQAHMGRRASVLLSTVLVGVLMTFISAGIVSWENFPLLKKELTVLFGSVKDSLFDEVDFCVGPAVRDGKFTVAIGGEHSVNIPIVRNFGKDDISVISIDAHLDSRDEYLGTPNSHACVMRRAAEPLGIMNSYIVWNNFVNHAKFPKSEKKRILLEHIAKSLWQTRGYSLSKRKPVPMVI